MIFSRRDYHLVLIMVAVLLLGMAYLLGEPMINQGRQAAAVRERLERDRAVAQRLLDTRGEWEGKITSLRSNLPTYGADEQVGAELLQRVRRLADENGVLTTRITPDVEKRTGDIFEQAVELTWEAELEPLVRFLYAVQVAGATLDIRLMTIAPSAGDRLKGNLKIFFAYQRSAPGATQESAP